MGEGVDAVIKYGFIDPHRADFLVVDLCRVGSVSTSGFYEWQARRAAGPTDAERLEAELVAEIRVTHTRSRGAYGCPRVVGALHKQGLRVNDKRIERLMANHDITGHLDVVSPWVTSSGRRLRKGMGGLRWSSQHPF